MQSSRSPQPLRIEKWLVNMQAYNFKVQYAPGSTNAADTLSRNPKKNNTVFEIDADTVKYVNTVIAHATHIYITIEQIKTERKNDPVLSKAIDSIKQLEQEKAILQQSLQPLMS